MENWESVVNLKEPLSAGNINDKLANVYSFIGVIDMHDLNKIVFHEQPIYFVTYHNDHWIAVCMTNKRLEIMDSTHSAFESPPHAFLIFLCQNKDKKVQINPLLQSSETNVCGLYCIFFVLQRSSGKTFNEILENFTDNYVLNDYIVSKLTVSI